MHVFRDKEQASAVIGVLLDREGLDGLWTRTGPSMRAATLIDRGGLSMYPREQRVVILAAFAIWGAEEDPYVLSLLDVLPLNRTARLRSLLTARAAGPAAVDRWLQANELN
jgi:hypothetical protein